MDDFIRMILVGGTLFLGFFLGMFALDYGQPEVLRTLLLFVFSVIAIVLLIEPLDSLAKNIGSGQSESAEHTEAINPVKKLQEQYVEGEISEEEFEAKLDSLSESQDVAEEIDEEPIEIGTER